MADKLETYNFDTYYQARGKERPVLIQQQPGAVQILQVYTPGFIQYGCCVCMNAPESLPFLSGCLCFGYPGSIRDATAGSRFVYITENGILYNNAYAGMRERCGPLWFHLCKCKAHDDIHLVPWDSGAYDSVRVKRYCSSCDWCTKYGYVPGPYTCGSCWFKCCPGCNTCWCKVCFMESCDERKQYCQGGDGTRVTLAATYCCGQCVRAKPGLCCGLCPLACASVARKIGCELPVFNEVFLHGKELAEKFVADVKLEVSNRKKSGVKMQEF